MANPRSLILAFIDRRPAAAARALAAMDPGDAAGLMEDIPTRYATRALVHMGAWAACGLVTRMSVERAAAIVAGFHFQSAAALLRLMASEPRQAVLEEMPAAIRRDFRMTLEFPVDSVGAHITTSILTQRMDHTVADGRDQIRRATRADTGCVIIVDEAHRPAGVVSPVTLLRSTGSTLLTEVMDTDVKPLSARARLVTVQDLDAWDRYASVPVVNRRGHVIGVLSHATLRQALAGPSSAPAGTSPGLSTGLADAFTGFLAGLAGLLAPESAETRTGPVRGKGP